MVDEVRCFGHTLRRKIMWLALWSVDMVRGVKRMQTS